MVVVVLPDFVGGFMMLVDPFGLVVIAQVGRG